MSFDENNITRRTNLETSDSISVYLTFAAQQNPYAFKVFYDFLSEVKPKRILEIGTGLGGLTMYLNYACKELNLNTKILSYDIYDRSSDIELRNLGIDQRIENVFNHDYSEVKNEVINFIQKDGTTVVLCDGGNKSCEFKLLSNFIKPGDFIMAHDYAPDEVYFNDEIYKKYWNWHEIKDSDIEESVKRNNLESYMCKEFLIAVWVCKRKLMI